MPRNQRRITRANHNFPAQTERTQSTLLNLIFLPSILILTSFTRNSKRFHPISFFLGGGGRIKPCIYFQAVLCVQSVPQFVCYFACSPEHYVVKNAYRGAPNYLPYGLCCTSPCTSNYYYYYNYHHHLLYAGYLYLYS